MGKEVITRRLGGSQTWRLEIEHPSPHKLVFLRAFASSREFPFLGLIFLSSEFRQDGEIFQGSRVTCDCHACRDLFEETAHDFA